MRDVDQARSILTELRAALADPDRGFAVDVRAATAFWRPTVTVTAPSEYARSRGLEFGEIQVCVERIVGYPVELVAVRGVQLRAGKPRRSRIEFVVQAPMPAEAGARLDVEVDLAAAGEAAQGPRTVTVDVEAAIDRLAKHLYRSPRGKQQGMTECIKEARRCLMTAFTEDGTEA